MSIGRNNRNKMRQKARRRGFPYYHKGTKKYDMEAIKKGGLIK